MVHGHSIERKLMFNAGERMLLLDLAEASIRHGLFHRTPLSVNPDDYPDSLRKQGACFVTLQRQGMLRGCIGCLEPCRPLIEDVAHNAFCAAFEDPRFPPLTEGEMAQLELHISILSPATPIHFTSEADLLAQLKPGIDGLIIEEQGRRGTFLPSVWDNLPNPALFLRQLKLKAGLPGNYWSDTVRVSRYHTESFGHQLP
jgi:AmmeMemoRadiSam system protein A